MKEDCVDVNVESIYMKVLKNDEEKYVLFVALRSLIYHNLKVIGL